MRGFWWWKSCVDGLERETGADWFIQAGSDAGKLSAQVNCKGNEGEEEDLYWSHDGEICIMLRFANLQMLRLARWHSGQDTGGEEEEEEDGEEVEEEKDEEDRLEVE